MTLPAVAPAFAPDHALPGSRGDAPGAGFGDSGAERPLGRAMLNGWRRRCPCCGAGPLLRGYLTVRDSCAVCNTALHHHRADDGPAYLTILIVGKIMAPLLLAAFVWLRPDPLMLAAAFSMGTVSLSLYLLPRLKGMIIGIQWAKRMHGFGEAQDG